jgi:glycosyltransferase involved in cell wall biosynthesis
MSVYFKEKPSYLENCLLSLNRQTLQPSEIVLVEDGVITNELKEVIQKYAEFMPIKSVIIKTNVGLAAALNTGLKCCSNELVARMDTDDVCLPFRFERQVAYMLAHPQVSVSSAWIEEKDEEMSEVLFLKKLPSTHVDILKFSKKRNPISHPVSIFRKTAVMSVGAYPDIFPEDYALWSLMIVKGFKFGNIPETLLYMRTGPNFMGRRGLDFFKGEIGLLKYQRAIRFLSFTEFSISLLIRAVIRLAPLDIRVLFYKFAR